MAIHINTKIEVALPPRTFGRGLRANKLMKKKRIFGSVHQFLEPGSILGRTVANEGFFRALLTQDPFDEYHFYLHTPKNLSCTLKECDLPAVKRGAVHVFPRQNLIQTIAHTEFFCFHLSDPLADQTPLAFLRNTYSSVIFPITSVPHSLSYTPFAREFLHELWPGVSSRDVICCTSNAAIFVLEEYFRELRLQYHLPCDFAQPALRLLPLGVDTEFFAPPSQPERAKARKKFEVSEDEVLCLVHGRITVDDKMDLLPLIYALKRIQKEEGTPNIQLIISGRKRENDTYPTVLENTAKTYDIPLKFVFDPTSQELLTLYHAADIFLSPSDNLQETFGLTMLEAAACGLPVVASDWDGYRDLVRHEETGLRIPTLAPLDTPTLNALAHNLPENIHQLLRAQQTVVNVQKLAHAISTLARSECLRHEMGEKARRLAVDTYDWKHIVHLYIALLEELHSLPLSEQETERLRSASHPCHLDIARIFARHPTSLFTADTEESTFICLSERGKAFLHKKDVAVSWPGVHIILRDEDIRKLLTFARHPMKVAQLVRRLMTADEDHEPAQFAVLWALKHDLLEFCEPDKKY